jgi:hypothetical protein
MSLMLTHQQFARVDLPQKPFEIIELSDIAPQTGS